MIREKGGRRLNCVPGETFPGNSPFPLSITRGVTVTDFKVGKPAERPGTNITAAEISLIRKLLQQNIWN